MFIGISLRGLLHGATLVVHSTVPLATVGIILLAVVTAAVLSAFIYRCSLLHSGRNED